MPNVCLEKRTSSLTPRIHPPNLHLSKSGAELLFETISQRYERASTLITSNRLCGAPHNRFNAESIFMRCERP
jgi:hypothetical protein